MAILRWMEMVRAVGLYTVSFRAGFTKVRESARKRMPFPSLTQIAGCNRKKTLICSRLKINLQEILMNFFKKSSCIVEIVSYFCTRFPGGSVDKEIQVHRHIGDSTPIGISGKQKA
jgi:hypothetical protein